MDGARLWEAQAFYCSEHVSLHTFCQLFDSINVSFYKGLGAITGAMLLSRDSGFADQARVWLRRFGGNLFSLLPYGVSCWYHFRRHCSESVFRERRDRLREVVRAVTAAVGRGSAEDQGVLEFDPAVPECSLVHVYFHAPVDTCTAAHTLLQATPAADPGESGIAVFAKIRPGTLAREGWSYFELNMGNGNRAIPVEDWVRGYRSLVQGILQTRAGTV